MMLHRPMIIQKHDTISAISLSKTDLSLRTSSGSTMCHWFLRTDISFGSELGPNCLQTLATDDKTRQ